MIIMEKCAVLFLIFNVIFPAASSDREFELSMKLVNSIQIKSFRILQKLDHFDILDDRKFIQNYWVSATFYRKGAPAFLFLNGEYPVDENMGFVYHAAALSYAQKLNAICFLLEHRFYSKTQPVNGSIHYLSSAQAIKDAVYFVKSVTKDFNLPKHTDWIVFGCSYAGALAVWLKSHFPRVIKGAIASSSPLLAKVDYPEYDQIVEESLKTYDPKCVESITLGFSEISQLVNSPQNRKNLFEMFYIDDKWDYYVDDVKRRIIYIMINIFSTAVQQNDVEHINISLVCRIMTEHNGTKLQAFSKIRKMKMGYKEYHKNMPSENSGGQNVADNYYEKWTYQRCNEFGRFSSYSTTTFLSPVKQLLIPFETEIEILCEPFFGPNFSVEKLNRKVSHTNTQYGGLDYNECNTIFLNGSLDPWHKASLISKTNTSLYDAIFIAGTSHCADVYPPSDKDIPELKNARKKVLQAIRSWIK